MSLTGMRKPANKKPENQHPMNMAARMKSKSEAGRLLVSETVATAIQQSQQPQQKMLLRLSAREPIEIKGKGRCTTYWVERADAGDSQEGGANGGGSVQSAQKQQRRQPEAKQPKQRRRSTQEN